MTEVSNSNRSLNVVYSLNVDMRSRASLKPFSEIVCDSFCSTQHLGHVLLSSYHLSTQVLHPKMLLQHMLTIGCGFAVFRHMTQANASLKSRRILFSSVFKVISANASFTPCFTNSGIFSFRPSIISKTISENKFFY